MKTSHTFHMGNKGHSITTKNKLMRAFAHNLRKYFSENYDTNKTVLLVDLVKSANDYEKYFNQLFEKERLEYNEKQKRADRKIENYFKHCESKSQDIAVEMILQTGDTAFWEENSDKRDQMVNVYQGQLEYLKELMPDLQVVNAIVHNDEKSPHMHVIAIPVAEGYTKGMKKQCSKTKVFTDKLEMLQEKLKTKGQELMKEYIDKDFEYTEKSQGRNYDLSKEKYTEIYQRVRKEIYENSAEKIENEIRENFEEKFYNSEEFQEKKSELTRNFETNYLEKLNNDVIEASRIRKKFIEEKMNELRKDQELLRHIFNQFSDTLYEQERNSYKLVQDIFIDAHNELEKNFGAAGSELYIQTSQKDLKSFIDLCMSSFLSKRYLRNRTVILRDVASEINKNLRLNISLEKNQSVHVR